METISADLIVAEARAAGPSVPPVSRDFSLDLRKLRVLQELDKHGTVAAAAAVLHLTPSAVSQQLAGLSRELGVPLLQRRGRGVALTGQARVVLRHAHAVQEQLERARAELVAFADGTAGEVRIAALATGIAAIAAPALRSLRQARPGLTVRVFEAEPEDAIALLDAGDVDIALLAENPGIPSRSDPRYSRVDLLTDVMDAVLPVGHPLADENGVRLADLAGEVWVGGSPQDACSQIAVGVCAAAGFTPSVQHHCREWDAVAALVAAGAGVALIPRSAYPLRPDGLACCPVLGSPASRLLFAVVRAGTEQDPGVAGVLEVLRQEADTHPR